MARLGLREDQQVTMETVADDERVRRMSGFAVRPYNIPPGCIGAYYPECNALIPLAQHAQVSKVPAAKSVPVKISASAAAGVAAE